jgi:hypothetical protein
MTGCCVLCALCALCVGSLGQHVVCCVCCVCCVAGSLGQHVVCCVCCVCCVAGSLGQRTPRCSRRASLFSLAAAAARTRCTHCAGVFVPDAWTTWFVGYLPQAIIGMVLTPLLLFKMFPPEVRGCVCSCVQRDHDGWRQQSFRCVCVALRVHATPSAVHGRAVSPRPHSADGRQSRARARPRNRSRRRPRRPRWPRPTCRRWGP